MRTDIDDSNGDRRGLATANAQPESAAERLRTLIGEHTSEINRLLDETAAREELLGKLSMDLAGVAAWTFRSVEALMSHGRAAQHAAVRTTTPPHEPTASPPTHALSIAASAPMRPASNEQRQITESQTRRPLDRIEWIHAELADTRAALELSRQTLERERTERLRLENVVREGYTQLKRRVVESISALAPPRATVAVVSKGDEDLVRLGARRGWHFPQTDTATYAGHHPADSAAAIAHLEHVRRKGAQYLVFPATSRWWLDHYSDFADYLTRTYRRVLDRDDVGVVFDVRRARAFPRDWKSDVRSLLEEFQARYRRDPVVLDCHTGLDLASAFPQYSVFVPPDANALPYLERTVDVVVHAAGSSFASEARRVAGTLLVTTGSAEGARRARHMSRIRAEWLVDEPRDAAPTVSIIIPCHNGRRLTNACLSAVEATLPASFAGEIIVIDDASTDGTRAMLAQWARRSTRVKILRNARNLGFLRSCNRAARAARGDLLVLLNNDTQPCPGWLTALLRTFDDHPVAGAVGGKLVFPDGRLQEAGGLVFRDGSAMHFGRGDGNPDHPLFNFVRPVDYCSAALLATPRRVFLEVGGFDSSYLPAYYEDTDYCFKLWDKGLRVYYQPAARVVHHEGVSCGTDLTKGVKRYQILNQGKFRERWKSALERQPDRPREENLAVWQRLAIRPAVTRG